MVGNGVVGDLVGEGVVGVVVGDCVQMALTRSFIISQSLLFTLFV